MLKFVKGDLFKSNCDVLVNATNKVGVMGGGIARQFKEMYPNMFLLYKARCDENNCSEYYDSFIDKNKITNKENIIICFHTKNHFTDDSLLETVDKGLKQLSEEITKNKSLKELSYAFPALGCGLGGLDWNEVKPLFLKYFNNKKFENIKILVYEPL